MKRKKNQSITGRPRETDDKAAASARREYIRKTVADQGEELSFQDVKNSFGSVSDETLYNDAHCLQQESQPVVAKGKHFRYSEEGLTTIGRRSHERKKEKESIGRAAAMLIMPTKAQAEVIASASDQEISYDLRSQLIEYSTKAHRLIILDSGSTTCAIARHLANIATPNVERSLAELRVLTNGDTVHQELKKKECTHGIIYLGGAERRDTGAIAGTLAVRCLEAWSLTADLAIVGTTNLDRLERFCCDSEMEAEVKSRLLATARIHGLAADAYKLMSVGGSSWVFAPFSRFLVDIIITDTEIWNPQPDRNREELRQQFLKKAHDRHIFVATETFWAKKSDG